jgi:hypothetical protein
MSAGHFYLIEREYRDRLKHNSDIAGHLSALRRYAAQSSSIVEFGPVRCNSTYTLLSGRPKKMRCYDIERFEPQFSGVEKAASLCGIDFAFLIQSSTSEVIDPCDLLFIDSTHYYEHCRRELEMQGSRVRRWIILHDTTEFEFTDENRQGRGLWPAIEEFMASTRQWRILERFTHCHGLTVLERLTG